MKTLAVVFVEIEKAAGTVDQVAKGILAAVKAQDAKTLEHFNELVADAYATNGWSQKAGRPVEGSKEKPAPDPVKWYVSITRRGYRLGLDITTFETMNQLKIAIKETRQAEPKGQAHKAPELKGIQVSAEKVLTGALWHDAVVLWEHLPTEEQAEFEKQVRKLLARFTRKAPAELKLVA